MKPASSSLQQLSSWLVNSLISAPFLQPCPSENEYICTPSAKPAPAPPLISADFDQVPDTVLYDWYTYN